MKKKYIKPSIVVEKAVLPAIMEFLSADVMEFAGGNGGTGGGTGDGTAPVHVDSKFMRYDGFGAFDTFDDEYDY
jgi:hypothetical protein